MGTPPILMRSQQSGALPAISPQLGRHLGVNGDHVAAVEFDPRKVQQRARPAGGYDDFYKGKPITTMSYDWYAGQRAHRFDGTRFTLQEILLSQLTNFLYDDGRSPTADPSWFGACRRSARSRPGRNHIELLAMVEDTHDGSFFAVPPGGGGHVRPNAGPVGIGLFDYALSEQSIRVRERADAAIEADRRAQGARAAS